MKVVDAPQKKCRLSYDVNQVSRKAVDATNLYQGRGVGIILIQKRRVMVHVMLHSVRSRDTTYPCGQSNDIKRINGIQRYLSPPRTAESS